MKKKTIILTLACLMAIAPTNYILAETTTEEKKTGPFDRVTIKIIDTFMDKGTVCIILQVRNAILTMLKGKLQNDKTRKGLYSYQESFYSIKEFAILEQEMVSSNMAIPAEFTKCLETVKADFIQKMHHFLEPVRNFQKMMNPLLKSFCNYHNIPDSLLLRWSDVNGKEDEQKLFNDEIISFAIFEEFCSHVIPFLGSIISGGPKSRAILQSLRSKVQNKHTQ